MDRKRRGVLTFEWILILAILVIGIVGGLAVVRDSQIIECSSVAEAIISLNSSYTIQVPILVEIKTQSREMIDDGDNVFMSDAWIVLVPSYASGSVYHDIFAQTHDQNVQLQAGVADPTANQKSTELPPAQPEEDGEGG